MPTAIMDKSEKKMNVVANNAAQRLIKRFDTLAQARANWAQQWQEVLKYTQPHMAFVTRQRGTQGERIDTDLYDSTARRANQVLAAGFHGFLTNPAQRWFNLRVQDENLNKLAEVKAWLSDTEDRMFTILNGSNFNQQVHQSYLDLGSVGTCTLFETEDEKDIVRFLSIPIEEVVIDEDSRGRVDTVMRRYGLTIKQAFDKFGVEAGEHVLKAFEKGDFDTKCDFQHVVMMRETIDPYSKLSINLPVASIHINVKDQKIVREGGFEEFPYFVTRFAKVSGDPYGYSPGLILLPDIKMLNAISKTIIKGAQKVVDPPLVLPHDGFILPLKTNPGGINYKTMGTAADKIEPILTGANLPVGFEMQNSIRDMITQGYFTDLFLTLRDQKNMTATEVAERVAEKMVMLGPTLGRLQSEMLSPVIERTFAIANRSGALLPAPEILLNHDLVIEYVSPLALAQKREKISGINQFLQTMAGVAQFDPSVLDKFKGDRFVDVSADVYGVDPSLIRDDEETAQVRQAKAEQQQQMQQMQMAAGGAQVAEIASKADKNTAMAEKARQS